MSDNAFKYFAFISHPNAIKIKQKSSEIEAKLNEQENEKTE